MSVEVCRGGTCKVFQDGILLGKFEKALRDAGIESIVSHEREGASVILRDEVVCNSAIRRCGSRLSLAIATPDVDVMFCYDKVIVRIRQI